MWKYQCRLVLSNIAGSRDIPICHIHDHNIRIVVCAHLCFLKKSCIILPEAMQYIHLQNNTTICIYIYEIILVVGNPCYVFVQGRHANNSLMVLSEQQMVKAKKQLHRVEVWILSSCVKGIFLWKQLNFNFCGWITVDLYTLLLGFLSSIAMNSLESMNIRDYVWFFQSPCYMCLLFFVFFSSLKWPKQIPAGCTMGEMFVTGRPRSTWNFETWWNKFSFEICDSDF